MHYSRLFFPLVLAACLAGQAFAQREAEVDFVRDVQPLLKAHCINCHGPKQQKNGFRLDRRRDALKGGTINQIGPGNSEASHLYLRLVGNQSGLQMPPDGPLTADQIKVIKTWIDQGAAWPDEASGESPVKPPHPQAQRLMELLRKGDQVAFRKLLQHEPSAAGLAGIDGSTPLMFAALYGDAEDVRLLLAAGADPNSSNDAGATALMWAADDVDKTRVLLRHKADANARSDDGRTPLHVATIWPRSYEVTKLLLDHGADPSVIANSYRGPMTPLRLAAEAGDEALIHLLLDRGANPKALGGTLPLLGAMYRGDVNCLNLLLESAPRLTHHWCVAQS